MLTRTRFVVLSILAAILAALFFLGIVDRPPFVATTAPDLVLIVALSDAKDIGGNIMRLLEGTIKGIRATTALSQGNVVGGNDGGNNNNNNHNKRALMSAASRYGAPLGSEYLSVGLYLDDPRAVPNPRWAIGYAVDVSHHQAQLMASEMGSIDNGSNPVRAVRISLSSTLSARVPWRSIFTPMIAPQLHWPRGMELYKTEGRPTTCGRHRRSDNTGDDDGGCAIALEAYVTGPKGSRGWIDYTIVMGDTTVTFDDLYPEAGAGAADPHDHQLPQHETPDAQDTEPQQDVQKPDAVVVAESEPQQESPEAVADAPEEPLNAEGAEHSDAEARDVGEPNVHEVKPEAEQETRHASEAEAHHSDPEEVDPPQHEEGEASGEDEWHAQQEGADGGGAADGTASATEHHEEVHEGEGDGDGNPMGDAEVDEDEESERESGDYGDEYGDQEEEVAEGEEEDEENEHEDEGYEELGGEEEEEEIFEEDEGGEFNDEEDEVEHFEGEDLHDEF